MFLCNGHTLIGSVTAQRPGIFQIGYEEQSGEVVKMEEKTVSRDLGISVIFY